MSGGFVPDVEKTWPEWADELGNTYCPGDIVAIAIVNGRSPQLVIAQVEKINRVNSYGEEIFTNKSFLLDEPIRHERECFYERKKKEITSRTYSSYEYDRYQNHICDPSCTEFWQTEEVRRVPSCTVKATPIADLRGFSRTRNQDGKAKAITYSIPENIILVEKRS